MRAGVWTGGDTVSSAATIRPSADHSSELATLRRLKQQVEVAIGCFEANLIVNDDSMKIDGYWDFRVGDFVVSDLKRRRQ